MGKCEHVPPYLPGKSGSFIHSFISQSVSIYDHRVGWEPGRGTGAASSARCLHVLWGCVLGLDTPPLGQRGSPRVLSTQCQKPGLAPGRWGKWRTRQAQPRRGRRVKSSQVVVSAMKEAGDGLRQAE